jgi:hypothetical protein
VADETNVLARAQYPITGSLTIDANADFRQTWTLGPTGAAIDLTGISFHMQVRLASDLTQVVLDLSTAAGSLVNGGTAGTLAATAPVSMTDLIAPGAYVADIVASADGAVVNLCAGGPLAVTVLQGVTR